MAELYWFPFFVKDWLSSPARMAMLPEQRGAYIDLLALAWGNGEHEPSLPSDDDALAVLSGLGKRWAKLGPLIRKQFEERDGVLYNAKLSAVWNEQVAAHGKAVIRGKAGAAKRWNKDRPSIDSPLLEQWQSESESEPKDTTLDDLDLPTRITVWSNGAITERWGEQINPLRVNGYAHAAADALTAESIPPDVARLSIYRQCRGSKATTPPVSQNYFLPGIRDDWAAEKAKRAAPDTPPPRDRRHIKLSPGEQQLRNIMGDNAA